MINLSKINDKRIETRLIIRTIIYISLLIVIIILWIFTKEHDILFITTIFLLGGGMYFVIQDTVNDLKETEYEILNKMANLIEFKDSNTGNHVKRVSEYTRLLATLHKKLNKKQIEQLAKASPLHDIGKISTPDEILNKPSKFTTAERRIMDKHAEKGYELLKDSKKDYLKLAAKVANEHHEKWDGTGYPKGLKGDAISIEGRITAIADVFDALSNERVYKEAWSRERIEKHFQDDLDNYERKCERCEEKCGECKKCKRCKVDFDPVLSKLFLSNLDKFYAIKEKYPNDGKYISPLEYYI